MLLTAPNGVKVEACAEHVERLLAAGFTKAAGKKEEAKPAEKKAAKPKE